MVWERGFGIVQVCNFVSVHGLLMAMSVIGGDSTVHIHLCGPAYCSTSAQGLYLVPHQDHMILRQQGVDAVSKARRAKGLKLDFLFWPRRVIRGLNGQMLPEVLLWHVAAALPLYAPDRVHACRIVRSQCRFIVEV